jgi:hypothetical protein
MGCLKQGSAWHQLKKKKKKKTLISYDYVNLTAFQHTREESRLKQRS